jgi:hypothetical protein
VLHDPQPPDVIRYPPSISIALRKLELHVLDDNSALRFRSGQAYETPALDATLYPDRKAMSVRIQFDKANACHTNLDFVTGRVLLILQSDTTVQAITVKLEGESKTRLAGPRSTNAERNDKQKVELEIHKVRKWCYGFIHPVTELALIHCYSCFTKF